MASKGIYQYTVQESNNAGLGQGGSVFLNNASTTFTPDNGVIVAIQNLGEEVKLSTLIPEDTNKFIGTTSGHKGYEGKGDQFDNTIELPASATIFGRFTSVSLEASPDAGNGIICYIG